MSNKPTDPEYAILKLIARAKEPRVGDQFTKGIAVAKVERVEAGVVDYKVTWGVNGIPFNRAEPISEWIRLVDKTLANGATFTPTPEPS